MATINGTFLPDIILGTSEDDTINGFGGADVLTGGGGNDIIDGGEGEDVLFGGDGDDTLIGGTGFASLLSLYFGGDGNDLMVASTGALIEDFDGGDGIDTVSFVLREQGVFVDLTHTSLPILFDRIQNTENVIGSAFADNISGNGGANRLEGGDGDDTLFGAGGNDVLLGGAGVDILIGGAGADELRGGAGDDVYDLEDSSDTVIELAGEGNDTVRIHSSYVLTSGSAIETVVVADPASTNAINLTGNEFANSLTGNAGANVIDGRESADLMTGLGGDDIYYVDNAGDVVVEAANEGNDTVLASVGYALNAGSSVETLATSNEAGTGALNLTGNELANSIFGNDGANLLIGNGGDDLLVGNGGNDVLIGRSGADTLRGGLGNDVYWLEDSNDTVIELTGQGDDTISAMASYQLVDGLSVETMTTTSQSGTAAINLIGNEGAQSIFGNAGHNLLVGGGGNDQLVGYEGNDILEGGAGFDVMRGNIGNDVYRVEDTIDMIFEAAGEGDDIVAASTSFTLGAGLSIESMTVYDQATTNALNLTGNELGQSISGNAGTNALNGAGGNDLLRGYAGLDYFVFDAALGAANADVIADFVSGTDKIAIDNAVFAGLIEGNLGAEAFVIGSAAADASDRIIYNQATGELFFDADGNGAGAALLFATLSGAPALTASDFMIV